MSSIRCPRCGDKNILAIGKAMYQMDTDDLGNGNFHMGTAYGNVNRLPISVNASAACNNARCKWEGKLREAVIR